MEKNFVQFFSPGSFVAETTTKPIDEWDVKLATEMAKEIEERYGATPYAFMFLTKARGEDDLDSKVVRTSCTYYINCKVLTYEQLKEENNPDNSILLSNMRINKWDRVVTTTSGWKWTQPLNKEDVVL